jgi:hypothetical protein
VRHGIGDLGFEHGENGDHQGSGHNRDYGVESPADVAIDREDNVSREMSLRRFVFWWSLGVTVLMAIALAAADIVLHNYPTVAHMRIVDDLKLTLLMFAAWTCLLLRPTPAVVEMSLREVRRRRDARKPPHPEIQGGAVSASDGQKSVLTGQE